MIYKKDVTLRFGATEDCKGCQAILAGGKDARIHSEACRDRIAQKLMEAGDERILRELDKTLQTLLEEP